MAHLLVLTMEAYEELMKKAEKIMVLQSVSGLLNWDQEVTMPSGAAGIRAKEKSHISSLQHELICDEEIGELLENIDEEDLDETQRANVREVRREYERAKKVPNELIEELSQVTSEAVEVWREAKENDDFDKIAPYLERIFELKREYAEAINPEEHPYDVLLIDYEDDISVEELENYFEQIKERLVPLIEEISEQENFDDSVFQEDVSKEKQEEFSRYLLEEIGYDFSKGRLDESSHPFTSAYGRITTRYEDNWLASITSTIHEAGHGMYEHGIPEEWFGRPVGTFCTFSVHESQSRLWENHVGRSKEFWKQYLPELNDKYGFELDLEDFYKVINKVEPGYIRVNADELTYNMHVILRFELEKALLEGEIEVEDLPELWNEKMEEYLGIVPPNDKLGVLQDIHWPWGQVTYFPTYVLGSMLSAQLFAAAEEDIENLDAQIAQGSFQDLRQWLDENVWKQGKKYKTKQLIQKATGKEPSPEDYLDYLEDKYRGIYGLD